MRFLEYPYDHGGMEQTAASCTLLGESTLVATVHESTFSSRYEGF